MFELWTVEETEQKIREAVKNVIDWDTRLNANEATHGKTAAHYTIYSALYDVFHMDLSNEKVRCAIQMGICRADGVTLIMGPGGCGKSLIYKVIAHCVPRTLCLAPTGVAAYNLAAQGWGELEYTRPPVTIHSGLGLPAHDYYSPKEVKSLKEKLNSGYWESVFDNLPDRGRYNLILIDEVSMISPNLLDLIITAAGELNIPVMLFGDPMQLRPVEVKDKSSYMLDEDESNAEYRLAQKYSGWNFFDSYAWMFLQGTGAARTIILDSVYRQSDPGFKSMLNRMRINEPTEEDWKLLESRCVIEPPEGALVLCKRNTVVDQFNKDYAGKRSLLLTLDKKTAARAAAEIPKEELFLERFRIREGEMTARDKLVYKTIASYKPFKAKRSDKYPLEDVLRAYVSIGEAKILERDYPGFKEYVNLYMGDRVMITKNCEAGRICLEKSSDKLKESETRVVNGMLGWYLGIGRWEKEKCSAVYILLDTDEIVLVPKAVFTKDILTIYGEYRTIAEAEQYPIKIAYATTYHKAQGLTLDKVHMILDGDRTTWQVAGLGYLGLSRCRTLEGLTISGLSRKEFLEDKESKDFMAFSESHAFC